MYDAILEILHGVWKNGLSLSALGTAVFVLLKQRKVKKRLSRYIPWLLEDDSEVKQYIHNQHLIMERLGIPCAPTFTQDSLNIAKKRKRSLLPRLVVLSHALGARRYINWRLKRMSNINRGILLPLLSAIALFVKEAFGYEISTELIDMAANIILYLIFFLGLFMNVTKKKKTPKQKETANDDFTTPIEPRV